MASLHRKYLALFAYAEIDCDNNARAVSELTQTMEKQRNAGRAERQFGKLIKDNQADRDEGRSHFSCFSKSLPLFQSVDQFDISSGALCA